MRQDDGIDRVAPTRRPEGKNAGTQRWRNLLFMHWEVPAEVLRPLIPASLALDHFEGRHFVGVVPFVMQAVRPSFLPGVMALDFLETNVRTYVHVDGRDPGVYFFSLEAASRLAVWAARATFGLPYYHATMRRTEQPDGVVEYETRRSGGTHPVHRVRYRPGPALSPQPQPGSLEHFLLERYLLFVERDGTLLSGQVNHVPYPAHQAEVLEVHDELVAAGGLPPVQGPPVLMHYSPGVDVEVFALRPVAARSG
jgi:uncharacterized protein YqjF (DUF2071 family)